MWDNIKRSQLPRVASPMVERKRAVFRFYEELNQYLPPESRKKALPLTWKSPLRLDEALKKFGVPVGKIDLIMVNGQSVDLTYYLQDGDRVAVYPVFETLDISSLVRLRKQPLRKPKFIVTQELGELATLLHQNGFDCQYLHQSGEEAIIARATKEKRIILTRRAGLLRRPEITHAYLVQNELPVKQLIEVLARFQLQINDKIRSAGRNESRG